MSLWRAGLTEQMLRSLKITASLCLNLRTVVLEGTPLPDQDFHILIGENSALTELSLRNNHIGELGARLIGAALSTPRTANRSLLSLNLSFNHIGDAGAKHIAQGLRLNRTLLCLSLAYNGIGDAGAADLAQVLGPFALTHEEVVERRKQLSKRELLGRVLSCEPHPRQQPTQAQTADSKNHHPLSVPSSSSLDHSLNKASKSTAKKKDIPKKDEKQAASQGVAAVGKKEETKLTKKAARGKGMKPESKERLPLVSEQEEKAGITVSKSAETPEAASPLLEPGVQHVGGKVLLPGNNVLASLNLSGNALTERSLCPFLAALERQAEGRGLLRLNLS
ncbi:hypothetical protein Z043_125314, partial [Scleropages formosus]